MATKPILDKKANQTTITRQPKEKKHPIQQTGIGESVWQQVSPKHPIDAEKPLLQFRGFRQLAERRASFYGVPAELIFGILLQDASEKRENEEPSIEDQLRARRFIPSSMKVVELVDLATRDNHIDPKWSPSASEEKRKQIDLYEKRLQGKHDFKETLEPFLERLAEQKKSLAGALAKSTKETILKDLTKEAQNNTLTKLLEHERINILATSQYQRSYEAKSKYGNELQTSKVFKELKRTFSCGCTDCTSALSPSVYLADLIKYCSQNLVFKDSQAFLTYDKLEEELGQPFSRLPLNCEAQTEPIIQARIAIEVLMSKKPPILEEDEIKWSKSVHAALLTVFGLDERELLEMRRTLSASDSSEIADQQKIVAVLASGEQYGIYGPFKTEDASSIDEAKKDFLERLELMVIEDVDNDLSMIWKRVDAVFGFKPYRPPGDSNKSSKLLDWRITQMAELWKEVDFSPQAEVRSSNWPLVDPDLLSENDLALAPSLIDTFDLTEGTTAEEVSRLWKSRREQIADTESRIKDLLSQGAKADEILETHTSFDEDAIKQLFKLTVLSKDQTDKLHQYGLTRAAQSRLRELLKVSNEPNSSWTTRELDDFTGIVLQCWKTKEKWKEEEKELRIWLDPDAFSIREPHLADREEPTSPGASWRKAAGVLRKHQSLLRSRRQQRDETIKSHWENIRRIEKQYLPILRDELIKSSERSKFARKIDRLDIQTARKWSHQYFIDMTGSGCAVTTRVSQAIESIQALCTQLRRGLAPNDLALELTSAASAEFDAIWRWLGSYETWRAAMFVLLYPENLSIPLLRRKGSPQFKELRTSILDSGSITASDAQALFRSYQSYFDDVCSLTQPVSITALTQRYPFESVSSGVGSNGLPPQEEVQFLFSLTTEERSSRLYWSAGPSKSFAGLGQSYWRALNSGPEQVDSIVSCFEYAPSAKRRWIYVVLKTVRLNGTNALWYLRFDLVGNRAWSNEPAEIDLRSISPKVKQFDAQILLSNDSTQLPYLIVDSRPYDDIRLLQIRLTGSESGEGALDLLLLPNDDWSSPSKILSVDHSSLSFANESIKSVFYGNPIPDSECRGIAFLANPNPNVYADVLISHNFRINAGDSFDDYREYLLFRRITVDKTMLVQEDSQWKFGLRLLSDIRVVDSSFAVIPDTETILSVVRFDGNLSIGGYEPLTNAKYPETKVFYTLASYTEEEARNATELDLELPPEYASEGTKVSVSIVTDEDSKLSLFLLCIKSTQHTQTAADPDDTTEWRVHLLKRHIHPDGTLVAGDWANVGDFGILTAKHAYIVSLAMTPVSESYFSRSAFVVAYTHGTGQQEQLGQYLIINQKGQLIDVVRRIGNNGSAGSGNNWFGTKARGLGLGLVRQPAGNIADLLVYHCDSGDPVRLNRWNGYLRSANGFIKGFGGSGHKWDDFYKPICQQSPSERSYEVPLARAVKSANDTNSRSNRAICEEMFFFVPFMLAQAMQRAGHYEEALDWFRRVLDYSAPADERQVYPGLHDSIGTWTINRGTGVDWLRGDPLDPHVVARGRLGSYARATYLAVIRCMLDAADAEFTRDSVESLHKARRLYEYALELLDSPDLQYDSDPCENSIEKLFIKFGVKKVSRSSNSGRGSTGGQLLEMFNRLSPVQIDLLIDDLNRRGKDSGARIKIGATSQTLGESLESTTTMNMKIAETITTHPQRGAAIEDLMGLVAGTVSAKIEHIANTDPKGFSGLSFKKEDGFIDSAGAVILPWTPVFKPNIPPLPSGPAPSILDIVRPEILHDFSDLPGILGKRDILDRKPEFKLPPTLMSILACVPPNPVLEALRMRADVNLLKLATCRNIAGMQRQVDAYAAPTDASTGMPVATLSGTLFVPSAKVTQATPYRFRVLLERCKTLVQHAQQVESQMLSALQQADSERFAVLQAKQGIETARSGISLQTLRVTEAEAGARLVDLQADRTEMDLQFYAGLVGEGMITEEEVALGLEIAAAAAYTAAAVAITASAWKAYLSDKPSEAGSPLAATGQALNASAGVARQFASFRRQVQQWTHMAKLASQDMRIHSQQARIAGTQVDIANQELALAELGLRHDTATIEFLSNKFTKVELYVWMSKVLEGAYRYFLQQATATAKLAEDQLAFERQSAVPPVIQADYWQPRADDTMGTSQEAGPDRRGLTGSTRLLADITRLEQHAFETDRRKLQLTKTISVAERSPVELHLFRESGVLRFSTPMEMFDRDYPGHYLRLIKRVRVSVIALIPPSLGIKAMLFSGASSRVVVGGDIYQTVTIRRAPDSVALSSPRESTGQFELEMQPEMMGPFEGIGVDTEWELRMPKASNPFDFSSIADVILTVDYTALHSFDYQVQVERRLPTTAEFTRVWSFRYDLADQWFDLCNPETTSSPMKVKWKVGKDAFGANMDRVTIQRVTVHLVSSNDALQTIKLELTCNGKGGDANTTKGFASSGSGAAPKWSPIVGEPPHAEWQLAFEDTDVIRQLFDTTDGIRDILISLDLEASLP